MKEYWVTLGWGLSTSVIRKHIREDFDYTVDENKSYASGMLTFGDVTLTNFPGDCGALILQGANEIDETEMKQVLKYASLSGFNKIFATIVTAYKAEEQHKVFKKARWRTVYKGKSNRNDYKDDIVLVKYIRNPKHKGY